MTMTWPKSPAPTRVGALASPTSRGLGTVVAIHACRVAELGAPSRKIRMKPYTFLALLLMSVSVGCETDRSALRTNAPDGLYRWEHTASKGYAVHSAGGRVTRVTEISTFIPQHFAVADFHPNADTAGFSVEIDGHISGEMREDWYDVVIIQNHKVYCGIAKRTASSAEVAVATDTRKQADAIVAMLRSRYSSSP